MCTVFLSAGVNHFSRIAYGLYTHTHLKSYGMKANLYWKIFEKYYGAMIEMHLSAYARDFRNFFYIFFTVCYTDGYIKKTFNTCQLCSNILLKMIRMAI